MKKIIILSAVVIFLFAGCVREQEKRAESTQKPAETIESHKQPKIEDFKITQQGSRIQFFIAYSDVESGIENAKLLIRVSFTLDDTRYTMDPYWVDYRKEESYRIITSQTNASQGSLIITSKTTAKNIKNVKDVTYDLILMDKRGGHSQSKTAVINFSDFMEM